jgi:hypothetical protein
MSNTIKYTEIVHYPHNTSPMHEAGAVQGDANMIRSIMTAHLKALDRKKESYFFRVEENGETRYVFNLKNSEYEAFKKHIPGLSVL